jgi:hypothetical protein
MLMSILTPIHPVIEIMRVRGTHKATGAYDHKALSGTQCSFFRPAIGYTEFIKDSRE